MKVISTRTTTPPPRKTPRRFVVELTEGEADLILGLLGSTRVVWGDEVKASNSPFRYVKRLKGAFQQMLGQEYKDTDAYINSFGEVFFREYGLTSNRLY